MFMNIELYELSVRSINSWSFMVFMVSIYNRIQWFCWVRVKLITLNNNNFKTSASIFLSLELTSVWAHPAPTEWERKAQRDEGFSPSLSKMATTESKAESLPKCRANLYTMTWYGPEGAQSLNWAHVRGLGYASSGERVPLVRIHRWPFWWTSEYEPCCRKQIAHEGGCDLSKKIQLIRRLQSKATAVFAACVHSLLWTTFLLPPRSSVLTLILSPGYDFSRFCL